VKAGVELGATALALTNINSTADAWDFVQFCQRQEIKPILGVEIRNGSKLLYILLAANNKGFAWINAFLSEHLLKKKPFPEAGEAFDFSGFVIYPLESGREPGSLQANEYIGVKMDEINKLFSLSMAAYAGKFVVRHPVSFQNKVYFNLHRLLRAIDKNVLLSKLDVTEAGDEKECFVPPGEIMAAYYKHPSLLANTFRLIDACGIEMEFGVDKNKKTFSATREDDRILLEKLARDGFTLRYGNQRAAEERLAKELRIIDQMGFNAYFLITWDMIRYATARGFYHVGRGSGANSIVAYCLRITDVDPIELDLYFERFLNPQRTSPPDFDIDFSYRDRDEVIDYVFKRYGRQYVALLGMYTTFQHNAIIRQLGKVFGLPVAEIEELSEKRYYRGDGAKENFMKNKKEGQIQRIILQYGKLLQNFPDHLSIHPGGILITEEPVNAYCAVHMPPKGFPTTQIDMFIAENVGLFKLDVLSQRGLGHIKESLALIRANRQIDIDIHATEKFKRDPRVREQIRTVNTIGCFYIESPAMRQLLRKLRCDDFLTLVAASSIIRPGVGSSGMMKEYIQRHHDPTGFSYLHPKLEELLKETYGVMVYQEDVLKVAHYWAGLDMADADLLRRATSSKYRGKVRLEELKERFFANGKEFGYPDAVVEEVWRQIGSFAEYSFCKAHSASYAVESYQSLYLKTYFPREFAVAVINNFGGFYSRELYFYELMKTGARVYPPCVNNGDYYTNIKGEDCWVGFIHIRGMEEALAYTIVAERVRNGVYLSLADLIERTQVGLEQLNVLIRVGALRFTGRSKKQLLWEANFLQKKTRALAPLHQSLYKEPPIGFQLPELPVYALDDLYDEIELLGFPARDPFGLVDDDPGRYIAARDLAAHAGKVVTVLGYHITQKPVRTVKGETMSFGTFIDCHKDWIDTVHFPAIYQSAPPRSGFYRITGKVVQEFGVYSIEVTYIERAGLKDRKHV
jgi:DNA polymerase-3 subunit alpha